jgi:hypothetical protein
MKIVMEEIIMTAGIFKFRRGMVPGGTKKTKKIHSLSLPLLESMNPSNEKQSDPY